MNKKVKEVALEALAKVLDGVGPGPDPDRREIAIHFADEFTKLIFKKTIRMFEDEGYDDSVDFLVDYWDINIRDIDWTTE